MDLDLEKEVKKAKIRVLTEHPVFGYFIARFPIEFCPENDEVAHVEFDARSKKIRFILGNKLQSKEYREFIAAILMHEALHLAEEHLFRASNDSIDGIVADWVVNFQLEEEMNVALPESALRIRQIEDKKLREEILADGNAGIFFERIKKILERYLKRHPELKIVNGEPLDGGVVIVDGGSDSDGDNGSSDEKNKSQGESKEGEEKPRGRKPKELSDIELEKIKAEVRAQIKSALASAWEVARATGRGDLPEGIERMLGRLFEPKVTLPEIIAFIDRSLSANDFTFAPPSRRSPEEFFLPGTTSETRVLIIGIDTSGSIDDKLLDRFVSELAGMQKPGTELIVAAADAAAYEFVEIGPYDVVGTVITSLKGGGGTDFRPFFKKVKEEILPAKQHVSAVVFLTDGDATVDEKDPLEGMVPIFWVVPRGGKELPWGTTIFFDPQEVK